MSNQSKTKKVKEITYQIKIFCEVNKYGAVIPVSSCFEIINKKGENENMTIYPTTNDIMDIWIGKSKQYPLISPIKKINNN